MDRYERLAEDCALAIGHGKNAGAKISDQGSANTDSVYVRLSNWREEKVIEAAKEKGVRIFKSQVYRKPAFIISFSAGQASRNTVAQEAACNYLLERGYKAGVNYHLD